MTQDAAWKLFEILDKVDDGGVTPGPILLVDYRSPSYEHCRSYPTPARPYRRSLLMANGLIMSTPTQEDHPMTPQAERRRASHRGARGAEFDACIVRKAIALQQRASTPSAVEYLKSCRVDAHIIQRVLSGQALRRDDRLV
jgi:hypothetical protein